MNSETPGRLHILVGHSGSGKTECSIALARRMAAAGRRVRIADLDVVNPYFRTREKADELRAEGIELVSSNLPNEHHLDMPALSASIGALIADRSADRILDVGGDPVGARVLARFSPQMPADHAMWMVLNANRPRTATLAGARAARGGMEESAGLRVTGLIGNTHMMDETGRPDLARGDALLRELAADTGLPVVFVAVPRRLRDRVEVEELAGPVLLLDPVMRPVWHQAFAVKGGVNRLEWTAK